MTENQTLKPNKVEEERSLETYIAHPYSYAFGKSTKTLRNDTLYGCLRKCAETYGNHLAIISAHENIERTFSQLLQDVDRFANALRINCDVCKDDVVSIWTANTWFFTVAQYAVAALGAILCPFNAHYKPREVLYCLEKVKPKVMIMPGLNSPQELEVSKYYKTFEEVSDLEEFKSTTIESLVYLDGDQKIGLFERNGVKIRTFLAKEFITEKYSKSSKENGKEVLKESTNQLTMTNSVNGGPLVNGNLNGNETAKQQTDTNNNEISNIYVDTDAPLGLFFTSGTTGMPKAATLTHFNLCNNTRLFGERVGLKKHLDTTGQMARICLPVPVFHGFGSMLGSITMTTCPMTIVMFSYRYTGKSAANAMVRYKCTHLFAVPPMLIDIMNYIEDKKVVVSDLDTVVTSSAMTHLEVMQRFPRIVPCVKDIQILYGSTETSPIITSPILGSKMEENIDNVGVPMDLAEVKLVDTDTKEIVKIGEKGELWTRGPLVFPGYYGNEQQTKKVIQNYWYNTGDLATMDASGRIRIVGRTKDLIIRGAVNIFPREIEEVLMTHPFIHMAAICGVPHERLNEIVCCWIRFRDPKKTLTEEEVKLFCKERMAYFKVPEIIMFVDELPMTESGKVQKKKMRELTCQKLGIQPKL